MPSATPRLRGSRVSSRDEPHCKGCSPGKHWPSWHLAIEVNRSQSYAHKHRHEGFKNHPRPPKGSRAKGKRIYTVVGFSWCDSGIRLGFHDDLLQVKVLSDRALSHSAATEREMGRIQVRPELVRLWDLLGGRSHVLGSVGAKRDRTRQGAGRLTGYLLRSGRTDDLDRRADVATAGSQVRDRAHVLGSGGANRDRTRQGAGRLTGYLLRSGRTDDLNRRTDGAAAGSQVRDRTHVLGSSGADRDRTRQGAGGLTAHRLRSGRTDDLNRRTDGAAAGSQVRDRTHVLGSSGADRDRTRQGAGGLTGSPT